MLSLEGQTMIAHEPLPLHRDKSLRTTTEI